MTVGKIVLENTNGMSDIGDYLESAHITICLKYTGCLVMCLTDF